MAWLEPIEENVRNEAVAVGTTAVLISPAHKRREIIISNSSSGAHKITLAVGNVAVAGAGILLPPFSTWYGSANSEFKVTDLAIYAISDLAAGQLSVFER